VSELYFANLTSPQVGALLTAQRKPVLLLPVGAVEPHGPHAPLSTDSVISAGMCVRAARRLAGDAELRVLILPTLPFGVTRYGSAFPGAVSLHPQTLRAVVVEVCTSLAEQGFRHLVLVNNHFEPEHVTALRQAVDTVKARIGYLDLVRRPNAARLTAEFRSGACHAGRYETSLVLADAPQLVDTQLISELPEVDVNMARAIRDGHTDFVAMGMTRAYCGAPGQATPQEGLATFDALTDLLIEVIRDVAMPR
jgi:creatinine amidohydrolase